MCLSLFPAMETLNSLQYVQKFEISFCLNLFSDSVTTSCGHKFCKACNEQTLGKSDPFKCPLCQESQTNLWGERRCSRKRRQKCSR
uniref:RING-type domain-containing protein n=1 Tax=Oncorhynchus mykiss TaxID=8022 RepID=A0A8C7PY34_ONCMY